MNVLEKDIKIINLGTIDYRDALGIQNKLHQELISLKKKQNLSPFIHTPFIGYIVLCEHPHVYTFGSSGVDSHLLVDEKKLLDLQASVYKTNRGGDITYHGPGQLVAYFILDLEKFCQDLHKYLRLLEEIVIQLLAKFGIRAHRLENLTGVWVGEKHDEKKICAIGIRVKDWVTMHGIALNVNTDLNYFECIIPCGIRNKGITSIEKVSGCFQNMDRVSEDLIKISKELFCAKYLEAR